MNVRVRKLIEQYFPNNKENVEKFISEVCYELISEIEKYSSVEYRKYKSSANDELRANPYVLGTSDGADVCAVMIKNMLDNCEV